jgi:hypothetical protein
MLWWHLYVLTNINEMIEHMFMFRSYTCALKIKLIYALMILIRCDKNNVRSDRKFRFFVKFISSSFFVGSSAHKNYKYLKFQVSSYFHNFQKLLWMTATISDDDSFTSVNIFHNHQFWKAKLVKLFIITVHNWHWISLTEFFLFAASSCFFSSATCFIH